MRSQPQPINKLNCHVFILKRERWRDHALIWKKGVHFIPAPQEYVTYITKQSKMNLEISAYSNFSTIFNISSTHKTNITEEYKVCRSN